MRGLGVVNIISSQTGAGKQLQGFRVERFRDGTFSKSDIHVSNINFFGNVLPDPASWNAGNYDSFEGTIPFFLSAVTRFSVRDCTFNDGTQSGLRISGCSDGEIENCKSLRMRGNTGDGYYIRATDNVTVIKCGAEDFTRIGFVCESGAKGITHIGCFAKNGHDNAVSYGGAEQNRGFWAENTVDIHYDHCIAMDIWQGGFVATNAGSAANIPISTYDGVPTSWASMTNCVAINIQEPAGLPFPRTGQAGFLIGSFPYHGMQANVSGCRSYLCPRAFDVSMAFVFGEVRFDGCHGETLGTGGSNASFFIGSTDGATPANTGRQKVYITNCTGRVLDHALINSFTNNVGSVVTNGGAPVELYIDNYSDLDDVCTIRAFLDSSATNTGSKIVVSNVYNAAYQFQSANQEILINGGSIVRETRIGKALTDDQNARITFDGTDIKSSVLVENSRVRGSVNIFDGAYIDQVTDGSDISSNNVPRMILDANINYDIAGLATRDLAPIRVLNGSAGQGFTFVSGIWRNTGGGGVPAVNAFIYTGNRVTAVVYANGVIVDDTVALDVAFNGGTEGLVWADGGQRVTF
jgi:hypothetical protein